jgi:hypothetical protein
MPGRQSQTVTRSSNARELWRTVPDLSWLDLLYVLRDFVRRTRRDRPPLDAKSSSSRTVHRTRTSMITRPGSEHRDQSVLGLGDSRDGTPRLPGSPAGDKPQAPCRLRASDSPPGGGGAGPAVLDSAGSSEMIPTPGRGHLDRATSTGETRDNRDAGRVLGRSARARDSVIRTARRGAAN